MNKKTKRVIAMTKREAFLEDERSRGLLAQKNSRSEETKRKNARDAKASAQDNSPSPDTTRNESSVNA